MLLRVVGLRVDFAHQVGNLFGSLQLKGSHIRPSQRLLRLLKRFHCLLRVSGRSFAEVIAVLSVEVASVMIVAVSRDDSSESLLRCLDWAVHKRQLGDVVLVDHAEHRLFFAHVHFWVLNFLLIRRFQFPLSMHSDAVSGGLTALMHLQSRRLE